MSGGSTFTSDQKLWMDHKHHAVWFIAGVVCGAIIW